jgi:hydrogenase maturation protein HypF
MAAAALTACGRGSEIAERFAAEPAAAAVTAMLVRGFRVPETSSAGRAFDAAAGLLGVKARMAFEGQAAMLLEGLAERHGPVAPRRELYAIGPDHSLSLAALYAALADEKDAGYGAAVFHATLVEALADWVDRTAQAIDVGVVACGGGCFLNAILARGLRRAFAARGIVMLEAMAVPPNDGGLSLGQAWVAMCHSREGRQAEARRAVIPAKAGIQVTTVAPHDDNLGPGLRRGDN